MFGYRLVDCLCDLLALRFWVGNGVSLLVVSKNVLMCVGHLIRTDRGFGSFSQIEIDYYTDWDSSTEELHSFRTAPFDMERY